jgi:hypothetical protein
MNRRTSTRGGGYGGLQTINETSLIAVHIPTPNLDSTNDAPNFGLLDDSNLVDRGNPGNRKSL